MLHWIQKYGVSNPLFTFKGPLVLPDTRLSKDENYLEPWLKEDLPLAWTDEYLAVSDPKAQIKGFQVHSQQQMKFFQLPPPAPPRLGRMKDFSVDDSEFNGLSLLVEHTASGVWFTGDGIGQDVADALARATPAVAKLTMFKIPHHGSVRNTQMGTWKTSVPRGRVIAFELIQNFNGKYLRKRVFRKNLREAIQEVYSDVQKFKTDVAVVLEPTNSGDLTLKLAKVHSLFKKYAKNNPAAEKQLRKDLGKTRQVQKKKDKKGKPIKLYTEDWKDLNTCAESRLILTRAIVLERIRDFFVAVQAHAYILSSNGLHGHPSVETILGLAWALKLVGSTVTKTYLFITAGHSIIYGTLLAVYNEQKATLLGTSVGDVGAWLNSAGLEIRCLRQSQFYMKLNPRPTAVVDATSFDINNATQTMVFGASSTISVGTLEASLETPAGGANFDRAGRIGEKNSNRYIYRPDADGNRRYINLSAAAAGYISTTKTSFTIVEEWSSSASQSTFFHLFQNTGEYGWMMFSYVDTLGQRFYTNVSIWVYGSPQVYLTLVSPFIVPFGTTGASLATFVIGDDPDPPPPPPPSAPLVPLPLPLIIPAPAPASLIMPSGPLLASHPQPLEIAPFEVVGGPAPAPTSTLLEFLNFLDLPSDDTLTLSDALDALVGSENATILKQQFLTLDLEKRVLAWRVDRTQSIITLVPSTDGEKTIQSASLVVVPAGATIAVGADQLAIQEASMAVLWGTTGEGLTISVNLKAVAGLVLSSERVNPSAVRQASGTISLRQYFSALNLSSTTAAAVTIGGVLDAILGSSEDASTVLFRLPSALLDAGFETWLPDLTLSTVKIRKSALADDTVQISEAKVIIQLPPAALLLNMAGLGITLSNAVLEVVDPRQPTQTIKLSGSASIGSLQVSLSMELDSDSSVSFTLALGSDLSLSSLTTILPGNPVLGALSVPFSASSVSGLSTSGVGIVIKQPIQGMDSYDIASVFAATNFQEWKNILPSGFPIPDTGSVRLEIINPLEEAARAAQVFIDFSVPVASNTKTLGVVFAAYSTTPSGDTAFLLHMGASEQSDPISLNEMITSIGSSTVSSVAGSIGTAMPVFQTLLDAIEIIDLTLALERDDNGSFGFTDFHLEFALDQLVIVPNLLVINEATMVITSIGDKWTTKGDAYFSIDGSDDLELSIMVPQPGIPGYVKFQSSGDISVNALVMKLGGPDLSGIPIIGSFLSVEIDACAVSLEYPPADAAEQGLYMSSITTEFSLDKLSLGPFSMKGLELAVTYSRPTPGDTAEAETSFSVEGTIGTLRFNGAYSSKDAIVACSLTALEPNTVQGGLSTLLGTSVPNALLPLIGDMSFNSATMELDSSTFTLSAFALRFVNAATLEVGGIGLTNLQIQYTAGVAAVDDKPAVPGSYGCQFSDIFNGSCLY
jgi:hypothetical protein